MAFRLRRSVKLFPGVRVNFGKRGASVSLGTRGARVTVGPRGTTTSLGIPGTGLSHRSRASWRRGRAPGSPSASPTSAGLGGCLVVLCLAVSCVVCVSVSGRGTGAKRSIDAPAHEPHAPVEHHEKGSASAPAEVLAFGDGSACRVLGACEALETPTDASGTTWRLTSASHVGDARIELQVTPDGRITSVTITGDPSGDLTALVLDDLGAPEADRPALTWHVRERVSTKAIDDAKPLCAAGLCVVAGLAPGGPATQIQLDPTIEADRRGLKRAARAAARAKRLEAHQPAKERPTTHREPPQALETRGQPNETSSPKPMRSCCKHCSSGIPCGDGCIPANRACRKGPGCAC